MRRVFRRKYDFGPVLEIGGDNVEADRRCDKRGKVDSFLDKPVERDVRKYRIGVAKEMKQRREVPVVDKLGRMGRYAPVGIDQIVEFARGKCRPVERPDRYADDVGGFDAKIRERPKCAYLECASEESAGKHVTDFT